METSAGPDVSAEANDSNLKPLEAAEHEHVNNGTLGRDDAEESVVDLEDDNTTYEQVTGENQLVTLTDSLGYMYSIKEQTECTTLWQCYHHGNSDTAVTRDCEATVVQTAEVYRRGNTAHIHPGKPRGLKNTIQQQNNTSTIIGPDEVVRLLRCTDTDCGCGLVHCPFCDVKCFKPAKPARTRDHLEMTHFSHAVYYDDLIIVKCFKSCRENYGSHYHCPLCQQLVLKRISFTQHLLSHIRKTGGDEKLLGLTDTKHPDSIKMLGFTVELCRESCLESSDWHYHCPVCRVPYWERCVFVNHMWRCVEADAGALPGASKQHAGTQSMAKNFRLHAHPSIVKSLQDYPLSKCDVTDCCGGKFHCPLCTGAKFKPSSRHRLVRHLANHWKTRVASKGYMSLVCYLPCQTTSDQDATAAVKFHYHCPSCGETRRRRQAFKLHVMYCVGDSRRGDSRPSSCETEKQSVIAMKQEVTEGDQTLDTDLETDTSLTQSSPVCGKGDVGTSSGNKASNQDESQQESRDVLVSLDTTDGTPYIQVSPVKGNGVEIGSKRDTTSVSDSNDVCSEEDGGQSDAEADKRSKYKYTEMTRENESFVSTGPVSQPSQDSSVTEIENQSDGTGGLDLDAVEDTKPVYQTSEPTRQLPGRQDSDDEDDDLFVMFHAVLSPRLVAALPPSILCPILDDALLDTGTVWKSSRDGSTLVYNISAGNVEDLVIARQRIGLLVRERTQCGWVDRRRRRMAARVARETNQLYGPPSCSQGQQNRDQRETTAAGDDITAIDNRLGSSSRENMEAGEDQSLKGAGDSLPVIKRGRGRPKKERPSNTNTPADASDVVSFQPAENPVKRSRGRPRKSLTVEKSDSAQRPAGKSPGSREENPNSVETKSLLETRGSKQRLNDVNKTPVNSSPTSSTCSTPVRRTRGVTMDFSYLHSGRRKSEERSPKKHSVGPGKRKAAQVYDRPAAKRVRDDPGRSNFVGKHKCEKNKHEGSETRCGLMKKGFSVSDKEHPCEVTTERSSSLEQGCEDGELSRTELVVETADIPTQTEDIDTDSEVEQEGCHKHSEELGTPNRYRINGLNASGKFGNNLDSGSKRKDSASDKDWTPACRGKIKTGQGQKNSLSLGKRGVRTVARIPAVVTDWDRTRHKNKQYTTMLQSRDHSPGQTDSAMKDVKPSDSSESQLCLKEEILGHDTSPTAVDNDSSHSCSHCDFVGESSTEVSTHLKEVHDIQPSFNCNHCRQSFDSQEQLNLHCQAVHPTAVTEQGQEKFKCDMCGKLFQEQRRLRWHLSYVHGQKKPVMRGPKFSCDICSFRCNGLEDIYSHRKLEHGQEIQCGDCGKTFMKGAYLETHRDTVHSKDKTVSCSLCGKTFNHIRYLKSHLLLHNTEKNFSCDVCDKKFISKAALKSHSNTHKPESERVVRYICSYCGKRYENKSNLKDHVNKHTGEKPYVCEICGKSFGFRTMLMKHRIYVHSSSRPFKCNLCEKAFKFERLLNNHLTTHTGVSRFVCQICSKPFSTKSTLKTHGPKCKGIRWQQQQQQQQQVGRVIATPMRNTFILLTDQSSGEVTLDQFKLNSQVITVQEAPQDVGATIGGVPAGENLNSLIMKEILEKGESQQMDVPAAKEGDTTLALPEQDELEYLPLVDPTATEASEAAEVYMCSECDSTFPSFETAERHVLTAHVQSLTDISKE